MKIKNHHIHITLLFLIILLAIFVRSYNISILPSGVYPDEANNATNAIDAIATHTYPWFYPDNNGREGLFLNLIALSFMTFGVNIIALKVPAIIMGVLTVCGVYALSREIFISKPRIALIACYLTAVSFWAINFSRIAFRANMMLPILTFSFFFLLRGIRTKHHAPFIFAGLLFGLGFHTYIAFRIAPLLLATLLILFLIQEGIPFIKIHWKNITLFVFCALITTLPMLHTFYIHPEYLQSRSADISVFAQKDQPLFTTLQETVSASLLKYNVVGDQNWRHGYPPLPTLEPFVGAMFVGGILISLYIALHFFYLRVTKKNRNRKFVMHTFLIAWFFAFLAPEFMTTEGLPHSLRSLGTLPVVFIFAAFFIDFLLTHAQKHSYHTYMFSSMVIVTFLIYTGFFGVLQYHIAWANRIEQSHAFNKNLTDIGKYVQTIPDDTHIYIITGTMERLPIRFLTSTQNNITFLYDNEISSIDTTQNFIVIMPSENTETFDQLNTQFDLTLQKIFLPLDSSFILIYPLSH